MILLHNHHIHHLAKDVPRVVRGMASENVTVAIYETPGEAAWALQELREAGFDVRNLSVAGKDSGAGQSAVCYYRTGGEVRYLGELGSFWNCLWEQLPGCAMLTVPGLGPVLVAGPLADWIVVALENASIFSGLTGIGAGLYSIGIPKEAVAEYEAALANNKYLLIAHGRAGEVADAKRVLRSIEFGAKR